MEQHISEVLAKSQFQQLSPKEVLGNYDHIELTEDEITEAMIAAKRKKESLLLKQKEEALQAEQRAKLTRKTTPEIVNGLMRIRMQNIFFKPFVIDQDNAFLYDLLCLYFGDDERFIQFALNAGVDEPSLTKGILLAGNFGVGKSWMMKLFARNQRQCYNIVNAEVIAEEYRVIGSDVLEKYIRITEAATDDPSVFYQKKIGLGIDDLGTEEVKNNFGNKKNVIASLIEAKYEKNTMGIFLHATTNLDSKQLLDYYGGRITSRMRESFNIIELGGPDRRK